MKSVIRFIKKHKSEDLYLLNEAALERSSDIKVFMAQQHFEKRKAFHYLEKNLKNDIKFFFGSYKRAKDEGISILKQIASPLVLSEKILEAKKLGLGWQDREDAFYIHSSLVKRLPAVLRAYINCCFIVYGDYADSDIVKIHLYSSKLTLLFFEDFQSPFPLLRRRIKINLGQLDYEEFDYEDDEGGQLIVYKSLVLNEEYERYEEQKEIEEQIDKLNLRISFPKLTTNAHWFRNQLMEKRFEETKNTLRRSVDIPDIDQKCGKHFKFSDFLTCSETYKKNTCINIPKTSETYNAIADLNTLILDPLIEYYGMIQLTYGFSSTELIKRIASSICPGTETSMPATKLMLGTI